MRLTRPPPRPPPIRGASPSLRRTLTAMTGAGTLLESRARAVVDYSLARRATLAGLAAGRLTRHEVCDALA